MEFNFVWWDEKVEEDWKYFGNFFLTNFLGRGWRFSRAVLQAGRDIFETKTSRDIHPERLTSNHATSSIQLDLPRLWSSNGICYFPDLFSAELHSGMAGWETGRPHRVKMEHNLTGTLAEAWEDMGSSYAFVTSQRHSVCAQIPWFHSGAATRHCDLGLCNSASPSCLYKLAPVQHLS